MITQAFSQAFTTALPHLAATSQNANHQLEGPSATILGAFVFFLIIASMVQTIAYWFFFVKAGRKGWESIIPLYETWVRLRIAGKPDWWVILAIIPVVGLIVAFIAAVEISRRFGKSGWFSPLLVVVPFVGYSILAFGKSTYSAKPRPKTATLVQ